MSADQVNVNEMMMEQPVAEDQREEEVYGNGEEQQE